MQEIFIRDFGRVCTPQTEMSETALSDKWHLVPYETGEGEGVMVSSFGGEPEDLTVPLSLTGYYKIYVAMLMYDGNAVNIRLSDDDTFYRIDSHSRGWLADEIEEAYWRTADLTGNSIVLSRRRIASSATNSTVAWIRLVPVSDGEAAAFAESFSRPENKRLYATDDIHNRLYLNHIQSMDDWKACAAAYENSDVEWLALEDVSPMTSGCREIGNVEKYAFARAGDRNVQRQVKQWLNDDTYRIILETGHQMHLKMCASLRAGAWGMGFPFTQTYFVNDFAENNPQLRCADRDGQPVDALSYAYSETQEYQIAELVRMAKLGFDAVSLIFHRGVPYVLFEKPVSDRYYTLYGEYPNEYPLDEERLNRLHCDIMTGFMRKLRQALDEATGKNKTEIHVRVLFSLYDSKCVGLDVAQWARQGLVDAVISYPMRIYESLNGDFWKDGTRTRINLAKYSEHFSKSLETLVSVRCDFKNFVEPYVNYAGKTCGPTALHERIGEFTELERRYGTKVYFDIMPRTMPQADFLEAAKTLYEQGAKRIALWDTYGRVWQYAMWNLVRRLGHRDSLDEIRAEDPAWSRRVKIIRIDGKYENRYKTYFGG